MVCFLKWACLELCDDTMEWVCTYGTGVKSSTLDRCAADCGVLTYTLGACTGNTTLRQYCFYSLFLCSSSPVVGKSKQTKNTNFIFCNNVANLAL